MIRQNKQLTFIDLFAGIGGLRRGLELAGHKCVGFCEWDKFATASYTSMHLLTDEQRIFLETLDKKKRQKEILKADYRNNEWYVSDIRDVTGENVPQCDCWCFGAPCFVAGTLVFTKQGMKNIEDIKPDDMVLTHKNRFQKVKQVMKSVKSNIYSLKIKNTSVIECTENHPFYVRYFHNYKWSVPCWKPVSEFTGEEYCLSLVDRERTWLPVEWMKNDKNRIEIVYNMEVEHDNSYTANTIGVHNCTDFSIAGKRKGLEGDASSLIREVFRILGEIREEDRPEWLIYENVKGMLSSNRGFDYLAILLEMDELGYDIEWQNLNTKDFGPPQNRERIFTVGHLRRCGSAKVFPVKGTDGEDSSQKINQIGKLKNNKRKNPDPYRVFDPNGIAPCLSTMQGGGREPHTIECIDSRYQGIDTAPRIYDKYIPTLSARDYKGPVCVSVPMNLNTFAIPVVDPCRSNKNMNGRRFKENEDPSFALTVQDRHGVAIKIEPNKPVCMPVLTPERENKRQNGRRFKENGEPSFTLTAQDRHGVAVGINPSDKNADMITENLGCLRNVRNEYGKQVRKEYEAGNLNISRHKFLEKEIKEDGITNTIDTVQKDNLLAVKTEPVGGCYVGVTEKFGRGDIMEGCFRTLKAANHDSSVALKIDNDKEGYNKDTHPGIYVTLNDECTVYAVWYEKYQCYIAIRKLTPKECFRLQGWTDDYFEKAEFVNSNSQLYKQAGNGVSVPVAYAVGEKLTLYKSITPT